MNDEEIIKETMMLDYSQLVMHNVYMIKENKRLENIIKEVREKLLCYGETFDLKLHQQMQKELLQILDNEKV